MLILKFDADPLAIVPFLNAGKSPGGFYKDNLPIHVAFVNRLPEGTQAVIATADLQGRELLGRRPSHPPRLLGDVLPRQLVEQILPALKPVAGTIDPRSVGILLAGDFYTVPALDKRGGSGDVTSVWRAFADEFQWVAGVAGNHDLFEGGERHPRQLHRRAYYLDEQVRDVGNLRVAGLGGIIGNPDRPHRRTEDDYLFALECLVEQKPDIIVTHDGPEGVAPGQRGSARVRELLEASVVPLVVRGHAHWDEPFCSYQEGTQILNVHARVVIMICP